jgi:hypothetical protein
MQKPNTHPDDKAAVALRRFLSRLYELTAQELERRAEELRREQKKAAP